MQSLQEKQTHNKIIKETCYITDVVYVLLHVYYLIICIISKTYILMWFNVGSIIIYAFVFSYFIKKEKFYVYAILCGNEFLISMSAGTILTGFQTGFFLPIIGLTIVSFFTTYFSKKRNINHSIVWSAVSFIVCIVLYVIVRANSPYYSLDKSIIILYFITHLVAIFLFINIYLIIFLKYATTLEERIINESRIDRLTHLHNRYDLYNYLDTLEDKTDYSLAMIDIDNFKKVNDKYGHICGDFILQEVARISSDVLSDSFVCRYGGEEFVIIHKMNGDINNSFNKLELLRKEIDNHKFVFNDLELHITITIGVSRYPNDVKIEEWINLSDELLYYGKSNGKNRVVM